MSRDRVESAADWVKLVVDGAVRDEQAPSTLRELLVVYSGWDVFANDESFVVAIFANGLWVLPELTLGMNRWLFQHWRPFLVEFSPVFEARLDHVPRLWRARRFGIPMPRPRLGRFGLETLPTWVNKNPQSFSEFPQLGAADA